MNDALIQLFIRLIATQTGLHIRSQDRSALSQKILTRMKRIKISIPENYYQLLAATSQESQNEWRELALLLTVNESYFMRDKGQLSLLEKVIFPELIEQKLKLHKVLGIQPTLRIWSAGCSTGEEPYSLLIILKQLIPDWDKWKILILGTDINQEALEKAQRGIYSPWSFRLVDAELQRRYFNWHKTEWEIDPQIRQFVNFGFVNLVTDNFPNIYKDIYNMDLILCRNVFVYFEPQYVSLVLKKFFKTLKPGGYLMTGHAEIHGQIMNEFQAKIFPESVVYQARNAVREVENQIESRIAIVGKIKSAFGELGKRGVFGGDSSQLLAGGKIPDCFTKGNFPEIMPLLTAASPLGKMLRSRYVDGNLTNNTLSASLPIIAEKAKHKKPQMLVLEAKNCFKNKAYADAIEKAQQAIDQQIQNFDAYYLIAEIHANLGNYSQAIEYCKRASKIDSVSILPYYLQAHIAEEQGELEIAKVLLKRTIYLCPSFVSAYLELGNIYHKEGKIKRAIKMYNSSCEILQKLPPNTPIEQHGKMTASQVLMNVKKNLLKLYSK
jgi:chemotaxis protein methyltransferase CheR